MATISADIAAVRTAVYGRDVREAIADALEQMYVLITDSLQVVNVQAYRNRSSFPSAGTTNVIYIDESTNGLYRWNGSEYVQMNKLSVTDDTTGLAITN